MNLRSSTSPSMIVLVIAFEMMGSALLFAGFNSVGGI